MENFRKAIYEACSQMNMTIVPKDIGARVMAWVGLQGGDERITFSPRLQCELEHLQELYNIKGGEVPDKEFILLVQKYTKELIDYTNSNDGDFPDWLNTLIQERYGFVPYPL